MAVSFWAVFCVIYGICTLLLPRKAGRMFVWHGFLAGMSVAFFCLHFLPGVFEQDMFYSVIAGVLGGVALGTAVEKHHPISGSLVGGIIMEFIQHRKCWKAGNYPGCLKRRRLSVCILCRCVARRSRTAGMSVARRRWTAGILAGGMAGFHADIIGIAEKCLQSSSAL